jgi:hypothetical protein
MKPNRILQFEGGGSCPVQYHLEYDGREYYIRYRHGWLAIELDDDEVFSQRIAGANDGTWSDEHTTVYLCLISDAIRGNSIGTLTVPTIENAHDHPMFVLGPLPRSHIMECEQEHDHSLECYSAGTYSPIEIRDRKFGG